MLARSLLAFLLTSVLAVGVSAQEPQFDVVVYGGTSAGVVAAV